MRKKPLQIPYNLYNAAMENTNVFSLKRYWEVPISDDVMDDLDTQGTIRLFYDQHNDDMIYWTLDLDSKII